MVEDAVVAVLVVPLALLRTAQPSAKHRVRIERLRDLYAQGVAVAPIPIRLGADDVVRLGTDGNHRLVAAREAKVTTVRVRIDDRNIARLTELGRRDGLVVPTYTVM